MTMPPTPSFARDLQAAELTATPRLTRADATATHHALRSEFALGGIPSLTARVQFDHERKVVDLVNGTARLGLRARGEFIILVTSAKENWDGWTAEEAIVRINKARSLVGDAPTAMVQADVWSADAHLHLGRLDEARELYERATRLDRAPRTEIARGLPWLDPRDLVDHALLGLRSVAMKIEEDGDPAIAAGEELRAFRLQHGRRELAAHAALWLARVCSRRQRYTDVVRWAGLAREELTSTGNKLDAIRAGVRLAEAHNNLEQWAEAKEAAAEALKSAELFDDEDLTWAAFEAARAERGLGNEAEAAAGFRNVFAADFENDPWRARASLIRLADIDSLAVVPLAREAVEADLSFYGPHATTFLSEAALVAGPDEARLLWAETVTVGARVLAAPSISAPHAQRVWAALAASVVSAPEGERAERVTALLSSTTDASFAGLQRLWKGLQAVGDAELYSALVDLALPLCDRVEAALPDSPTLDDLTAVASAVWELRRGFRYSDRRDEAFDAGVRLVANARRAGTGDDHRRFFLALSLKQHGHDLQHADRPAEAITAYAEAADLLSGMTDRDPDAWPHLCEAITFRAAARGKIGDGAGAAADFAQVQSAIDEHPHAAWSDRAHQLLAEIIRS